MKTYFTHYSRVSVVNNVKQVTEAAVCRCSSKQVFLNISQYSNSLKACNFIKKETQTQVFSCE